MQELKLSQTLDGANMSPYHTTGEFATSLVLLRSRAELCLPVSLSIKFLLSLSRICAYPTNICLKCVLSTSIINGEIKRGISRRLRKDPLVIHLRILCPTNQKHTYEIAVVLHLKEIIAFDYIFS